MKDKESKSSKSNEQFKNFRTQELFGDLVVLNLIFI